MSIQSNIATPETTAPAGEAPAGAREKPSLVSRNKELLPLRDMVLHAAFRITGSLNNAEDVVQEAYLKGVQVQEPLLTGTDLRHWFLKLTVNVARDYLRSEKSRKTRERKAAMENLPSSASGASGDVAAVKECIETELAKLDETYRLPISFHYEQGLSYEEAAYVLDIPAGTLRWRASEGIKLLRERLGQNTRPVSAEILLAVLGAGFVCSCSPALAASVETIVAKSTIPALKVFSLAPAKSGGTAVLGKLALGAAALLVAGALVVAGIYLRGNPDTATNQAQVPAQASAPLAPEGIDPNVKSAAADDGGIVVNPPPNVPAAPPLPPVPLAVNPPENAGELAPQGDVEAQWNQAVELLQLVDPARDAVVGKWSLTNKGLEVDLTKCARLAIPYQPPEEYDFRVDFTREKNAFDVNLIFPMNGQSHLWMMDSWQSCAFGGTWKNPDAVPSAGIANHVRHTVIVQVRAKTLKAWLDGHLLQSITLWKSRSLVNSDWRLPDENMLGVGSWNNAVVFHRIAVRAVKGDGKVVPPDPADAEVVAEEHWKDAADLMPKAVDRSRAYSGAWTAANGALSVAAQQNARYDLGYQPPEEYDFRVEFTRTSGVDEIAQIVSAFKRQFAWKIDAKTYCSFDTIAGQIRGERAATMHTPGLVSIGKTVTSIVSVRRKCVKAYIDGKLLASWQTNYADMALEPGWKLSSPETLGIGATLSNATFHKIQIKEVTGQGKPLSIPQRTPTRDEF